jgi:hypothetical protein
MKSSTVPHSLVDLWRALGGDDDLAGTILRDTITRILAQEFDLRLGVEDWLAEAASQDGLISYPALKRLFESTDEHATSIVSSIISLSRHEKELARFERWASSHY